MSYASDRKWSDKFLPEMKRIIGPRLLEPADLERDMEQVTDLMVLRAKDMRIACRVRRPGFAGRFPWDITLREKRDNGAKTELAKIVQYWGDWMFYGHASEDDRPTFDRWFLIDLHIWRESYLTEAVARDLGLRSAQKKLLRRRSNGDGTHFVAFDVRDFPARMMLASSHAVPYPSKLNGATVPAPSGMH